MHSRQFTSLFRLRAAAGCNHVPDAAPRPILIPVRFYHVGLLFTVTNMGPHVLYSNSVIRKYPREDLIVTGLLYKE